MANNKKDFYREIVAHEDLNTATKLYNQDRNNLDNILTYALVLLKKNKIFKAQDLFKQLVGTKYNDKALYNLCVICLRCKFFDEFENYMNGIVDPYLHDLALSMVIDYYVKKHDVKDEKRIIELANKYKQRSSLRKKVQTLADDAFKEKKYKIAYDRYLVLYNKGLTNDYCIMRLAACAKMLNMSSEMVDFSKLLMGTKYEALGKINLAKNYVSLQSYKTALELFLEVYESGNNSVLFDIAKLYVLLNDSDKAKEFFLKAYESAPDFTENIFKSKCLTELGKICYLRGELDEARNYFKILLNGVTAIDIGIAKMWLGKIEAECDNISLAENYFEDLIQNGNKKDVLSAKLELGRLKVKCCLYDDAREIFLEMYKKDGNLFALQELAELELLLGNYKKMNEYCRLLSNCKDDSDVSQALFIKAKAEKQKSNWDKALEYLDQIYQLFPYRYDFCIYEKSLILYSCGRYDEAIKYLKEYINTGKKLQIKAILLLSNVYTKIGEYDKGIDILKLLINSSIHDEIIFRIAEIYMNFDLETARKLFRELKGTSFEKKALFNIAVIDGKNGIFWSFEKKMNSLLGSSMNKSALIALAEHYYNFSNYHLAKKYYTMLLETSYNLHATLYLGRIAVKYREYDVAEGYFKSLLNTSFNKLALMELVNLSLDQKNTIEARKYIEIMLNSNPTDRDLLVIKRLEADILFAEGKCDLAKKYFEELIDSDFRFEAISKLGLIGCYYKNYDDAIAYYDSILNDENKYFVARSKMYIYLHADNEAKALECFKQLYKTKYEPDAFQLLINYYLKKDLDLALKYTLKAKRLGFVVDKNVILYLEKYFNIYICNVNNYYSYLTNQIIDYDEYVAMDHIVDRHEDSFAPNIDYYTLFNTVKGLIKPEYRNSFSNMQINDIYDIPFDNVGANGEGYLRIVTLPNSKDILSMYTVPNIYNIRFDDLQTDEFNNEHLNTIDDEKMLLKDNF